MKQISPLGFNYQIHSVLKGIHSTSLEKHLFKVRFSVVRSYSVVSLWRLTVRAVDIFFIMYTCYMVTINDCSGIVCFSESSKRMSVQGASACCICNDMPVIGEIGSGSGV